MSKITRRAAAAALATGAMLTVGLVAAPAAEAATWHGCPTGYVCIYPQNAGWNNDRPSLRYYNYGSYNLSGQYGQHWVLNNQTGGAKLRLYTGFGATGGSAVVNAGTAVNYNLTPINSIQLRP
ncbi:hypothetical protein HQQ81_04095 [Microbacteriaceae bacterium VKM Ac-2854]|nr:hypothetical protein [Microbacteriaceae bacterium VKM Ac-2854]